MNFKSKMFIFMASTFLSLSAFPALVQGAPSSANSSSKVLGDVSCSLMRDMKVVAAGKAEIREVRADLGNSATLAISEQKGYSCRGTGMILRNAVEEGVPFYSGLWRIELELPNGETVTTSLEGSAHVKPEHLRAYHDGTTCNCFLNIAKSKMND